MPWSPVPEEISDPKDWAPWGLFPKWYGFTLYCVRVRTESRTWHFLSSGFCPCLSKHAILLYYVGDLGEMNLERLRCLAITGPAPHPPWLGHAQ